MFLALPFILPQMGPQSTGCHLGRQIGASHLGRAHLLRTSTDGIVQLRALLQLLVSHSGLGSRMMILFDSRTT
jgi:hypothetical protein